MNKQEETPIYRTRKDIGNLCFYAHCIRYSSEINDPE